MNLNGLSPVPELLVFHVPRSRHEEGDLPSRPGLDTRYVLLPLRRGGVTKPGCSASKSS